MSFSSDVKKELIEKLPSAQHCRLAELSAMFLLGAKRMREDESGGVEFSVENEAIAKKCFTFLKKSFNIETVVECVAENDRRRREYVVRITEKQAAGNVLARLGLSEAENGSVYRLLNEKLLTKPCCKRSWIRGLFLMSGTVNNPAKSYHFEIAMPTVELAKMVVQCLKEFGCEAKETERRQNYAVYLKDGSQIADVLKVMEAHVSLMHYENERAMKETRGSVNRRVNCEVSNLNKTAAAAKKQVEDIILIRDTIGFSGLSEDLEKVARLRLEYPVSSLKELGEYLQPPLGRSGVNHRLQKLCAIAEGLRSK